MSLKPKHSSPAAPWLLWTLAFRLSAAYSLGGLLLLLLGTASLYIVLRIELERSTEMFLADKLHVLRSMLRERPDDEDALREEIELESAARRYQQFYIRLLDEHGAPILTTPGMGERLDLAELASRTRGRSERSIAMAADMGNHSGSLALRLPSARRRLTTTRFKSPSTSRRKRSCWRAIGCGSGAFCWRHRFSSRWWDTGLRGTAFGPSKRSPSPRGESHRRICANGSGRKATLWNSLRWPALSTRCWIVLKNPSSASRGSPPTSHTICARRSTISAEKPKWLSPARGRLTSTATCSDRKRVV